MNFEFLKEINTEFLRRTDLDTDLRFDPVIPYFEKLKNEFSSFRDKDQVLMESDKQTITRVFNEFTNLVQAVQNFEYAPNESKESAKNRRNKIVENVKQLNINFTTYVLPIYLRIKLDEGEKDFKTKVDEFEKIIVESEKLINTKVSSFEASFNSDLKRFENQISQSEQKFNSIIKDVESKSRKAGDIIQEAQNFSVGKLVERYGEIFSQQAEKHKKVARISLGLFIFSLCATVGLTFYYFNPILDKLGTVGITQSTASTTTPIINEIGIEYMIANIIFRLTLIGLALIFVKESLKNYNSSMHLYNLNCHRQNSLQSFDMLISNTQNPETRDAVIKEIAQTIYSNQDDGYLSTDKKQISTSEIIDIIKTIKN